MAGGRKARKFTPIEKKCDRTRFLMKRFKTIIRNCAEISIMAPGVEIFFSGVFAEQDKEESIEKIPLMFSFSNSKALSRNPVDFIKSCMCRSAEKVGRNWEYGFNVERELELELLDPHNVPHSSDLVPHISIEKSKTHAIELSRKAPEAKLLQVVHPRGSKPAATSSRASAQEEVVILPPPIENVAIGEDETNDEEMKETSQESDSVDSTTASLNGQTNVAFMGTTSKYIKSSLKIRNPREQPPPTFDVADLARLGSSSISEMLTKFASDSASALIQKSAPSKNKKRKRSTTDSKKTPSILHGEPDEEITTTTTLPTNTNEEIAQLIQFSENPAVFETVSATKITTTTTTTKKTFVGSSDNNRFNEYLSRLQATHRSIQEKPKTLPAPTFNLVSTHVPEELSSWFSLSKVRGDANDQEDFFLVQSSSKDIFGEIN